MRRRREHDNNLPLVWLMIWVAWLGFHGCEAANNLVQVVVGGSLDPPKYPGQVATFGNQAPENLFVPNINLILPPSNQTTLCRYPVEATTRETQQEINNSLHDNNTTYMIVEEDDTHLIARENMSVALLVSYGECLPTTKAKVALALRQNFTRYGTVTHLVIYNNDYNKMDELHTLTSYMHDDDDSFSDITILFISTRSGHDILESITKEQSTPVSFLEPPPYAYGEYSSSGTGFHDIDPYRDDFGPDPPYLPPRTESGIPESDDFYWFRLIVFSLLVVSPCFRAAYLWYAGGARIRFRYNEEGRIVGLQYIPPMPYWFAPRPDENYTHPATRMTREQVLALPEIVFTGSPGEASEPLLTTDNEQSKPETEEPSGDDVEGNSDDTNDDTSGTINKVNTDESPSLTASATDSSTPLASSSADDNMLSSNNAVEDEEQGVFPSEMHSTCSICIDDFEQGERLRMLPRCRHIFHTDCILPWLTERQGCCPLCKTEVMEPEHEEEGSEPRDDNTQNGDNNNPGVIPLHLSADSADFLSNEGQQ